MVDLRGEDLSHLLRPIAGRLQNRGSAKHFESVSSQHLLGWLSQAKRIFYSPLAICTCSKLFFLHPQMIFERVYSYSGPPDVRINVTFQDFWFDDFDKRIPKAIPGRSDPPLEVNGDIALAGLNGIAV